MPEAAGGILAEQALGLGEQPALQRLGGEGKRDPYPIQGKGQGEGWSEVRGG